MIKNKPQNIIIKINITIKLNQIMILTFIMINKINYTIDN